MYIAQRQNEFRLSLENSPAAVACFAPAIIEEGGRECRLAAASESDGKIIYSGCGLRIVDQVTDHGDGLFAVERKVTNLGADKRRIKLIFELKTGFVPAKYLIPCVMYNGNEWGVGNEPKGLDRDGEPWIFAYDRVGIPSCTLTENKDTTLALFASDRDADSLRSACSMTRNDDGTFNQRLYYPVTEAPYTYAAKRIMSRRYDEHLTLKAGGQFAVRLYIHTAVPRWENYGYAATLDRALDIFRFDKQPGLTPARTWDLGIAFLQQLIYDWKGYKLIIGGIDTRLSCCQSGFLGYAISPAEMVEMAKDPANTTLGFHRVGFQMGWSGQNFLTCRLFILDSIRTGDPALRDTALTILDNWVAKQRDNGLLHPRFQLNCELEDKVSQADVKLQRAIYAGYCADTCNLGWGASEMIKIYVLLKGAGIEKPEYLRFATRICDFFVGHYSADFGFGRAWTIAGECLDGQGTIGGFILAALLDVYRWTKNEDYLHCAQKALDFYYARDLDQFVCTAGAIDCVSVDKETAYPFIAAALDLYEITGEARCLERAEKAAYYFFSWVYHYDALYPDSSDFARYGYYTSGGTAVSAEHHAIDPFGAVAVADFLRLYRYTQNQHWLQRARMMWCNALLGITNDADEIIHGNHRPLGSQNEAFLQCRWTKYRPTCEERGHFNDWLVAWVSAFRLKTLNQLTAGEQELLS